MHLLIHQFGDAMRNVLSHWNWMAVPLLLMILGIFRRMISPIPSRKPTFGRD